MWHSVRVVLVGTSLVLAGHLGSPGVAGTEPLPFSLQESSSALCDGGDGGRPLEPEAFAVCAAVEFPSASLSVKQPESGDSSSAPITSATPMTPEAPVKTVIRPTESTPTVPPSVPVYQVEDNRDVRRFLDQFQTGYRRAVVERWLVRAGRYLPMVLDVFKQKGLPEELVFTAMIESGFDPLAVSRAGAKGLWQFMAPTARRYGLRVDEWLDERLDPEKSTIAAARHFVDLYAVFGSWNLAQAAYNAGERTVLEAIRAMGTSDFWALSRGRWLKDETKNFIPAIQAATLIAREPERYGFVVTPAAPLSYEVVTVPGSMSLKQLALTSGIGLDAMERLNPELRLKQTPPGGAYPLKVPIGGAVLIRANLEREAAARHVAALPRGGEHRSGLRPTSHTAKPAIHIVKRQETVIGIAKRYGVSVGDLVRWNDLDDAARIRPGERLRVASLGRREEAQGGFQ
jgi:membrane-bound lytic murein transglycosylase D